MLVSSASGDSGPGNWTKVPGIYIFIKYPSQEIEEPYLEKLP